MLASNPFETDWGVVELKTRRLPEAGRILLVEIKGLPFVCIHGPNVDLDSKLPEGEDRTEGQGFTVRYFPLGDVTCFTELSEAEARAEAVGIAFQHLIEEEVAKKSAPGAVDALVEELEDVVRKEAAQKSKHSGPRPKEFGGVIVGELMAREQLGAIHGSDVCEGPSGDHHWLRIASAPRADWNPGPDHPAEREHNQAQWFECAGCPTWAELAGE
jgi:hypothetical protein